MKLILEFNEFNKANVEEVDGIPISQVNKKIERGDFSFEEDFTCQVNYQGETKEITIPHDILIEFIESQDPKISKYLKDSGINDIESVFSELSSFGWDFASTFRDYIGSKITPDVFNEIEDLNDDREIDWTEEDQQNLDDLLDQINPE